MKITDHKLLIEFSPAKVQFFRIDPEDISVTLKSILRVLMDLSWLSKFDQDFEQKVFESRATKTIEDIKAKFDQCVDDGITKDADFIFDARFLPNPYWDPNIREYCGLEKPIKDFFAKYPEVDNYIDKIDDLLNGILKPIEQSDRSYLTVAIGCTGGFHRSVYIAQSLADRFKARGIAVKVRHRTLIKKKIQIKD